MCLHGWLNSRQRHPLRPPVGVSHDIFQQVMSHVFRTARASGVFIKEPSELGAAPFRISGGYLLGNKRELSLLQALAQA